jgi:RNA polymerase sigma factor (sigma-70 family)
MPIQVNETLLQAAHRGERRAQHTLYRICFPVLMTVCVRYQKDRQEALAALNVGFLKVLNKLDTYTEEAPFEAWIKRIMINTMIDSFRREKNWRTLVIYPEHLESEMKQQAPNWSHAEQGHDLEYLELLIQQLPPITRQVFNLFAIDGYSHREISELLDMSDGTSKWHVSQARKQLQVWLSVKKT